MKTDKNGLYESNDKMVSHPSHYQSKSGLEVIDVIEAFTEGLTGIEATDTGNIIKYACRWKDKNGIQDLEKILWYTQHLITHLKSNTPETTINPNGVTVKGGNINITANKVGVDSLKAGNLYYTEDLKNELRKEPENKVDDSNKMVSLILNDFIINKLPVIFTKEEFLNIMLNVKTVARNEFKDEYHLRVNSELGEFIIDRLLEYGLLNR